MYENNNTHDLQTHDLKVTHNDQGRFDFMQVHFFGWPDFGVREKEQNLVNIVLLQFTITSCAMSTELTRIVAHYSAKRLGWTDSGPKSVA